jgi:TolB-like protein
MKKLFFFLITVLIFGGCAQKAVSIQPNSAFPKEVKIIPFANLTQNPLAGYKVASIANGVIKEHNIKVDNSLFTYPEKDYSLKEIQNILNQYTDGYIVTGFVNEYKYKAGIDANPAVSITLKVYDAKNKKYIFTATISETGNAYDSLGVITQNCLKALMDEISQK